MDSAPIARRILVVARNHTAVNWINELLPALVEDPRIQTHFSIPTTQSSLWTNGVETTLDGSGAIRVPWEKAVAEEYDLAIAATHLGDLDRMRSPLLLLPHGPGFTRKSTIRENGIVPIPQIAEGQRPRTTVVLSHGSQRDQFVASTEVRFVVAGDPCWDTLHASNFRRDWYRSALGVGNDQHFVLISSTWGQGSLFGQCPDLIPRLIHSLPCDQFQVGLVLHPNIWAAHGEWQLRAWLGRSLDSGMRLLTPHRAWRAGVVAADLVIGDHGSVGLYACALGTPLLLATSAQDELVAESTIDRLINGVPTLDGHTPLLNQIESAIQCGPSYLGSELADASFAAPGHAHAIHRALLYTLLDLSEPVVPAEATMAPAPEFEWAAPQSWVVCGHVSGDARCPHVNLSRHSALIASNDDTVELSHISALANGANLRITQSADVIISEGVEPSTAIAPRRVSALFDRFPGASVVTAQTGPRQWLIGLRGRPHLEAVIEPRWDPFDGSLVASAAHILDLHQKNAAADVTDLSITLGDALAAQIHLTRSTS